MACWECGKEWNEGSRGGGKELWEHGEMVVEGTFGIWWGYGGATQVSYDTNNESLKCSV